MQKEVLVGVFDNIKDEKIIFDFIKRMDKQSLLETLELIELCKKETQMRWTNAVNRVFSFS